MDQAFWIQSGKLGVEGGFFLPGRKGFVPLSPKMLLTDFFIILGTLLGFVEWNPVPAAKTVIIFPAG